MHLVAKVSVVLAITAGGVRLASAGATGAFQIPDSQLSDITVNASTPVDILKITTSVQVPKAVKQLQQYVHYQIDSKNLNDLAINLSTSGMIRVRLHSAENFSLHHLSLTPVSMQPDIGLSADQLTFWNSTARKGFTASVDISPEADGFHAIINEFGDLKGADLLLSNIRVGVTGKVSAPVGDLEVRGFDIAGTRIHARYY